MVGVGDWSDGRENNTFAHPKLLLVRLLKEGILSFASSCELVKFAEFWEVSRAEPRAVFTARMSSQGSLPDAKQHMDTWLGLQSHLCTETLFLLDVNT